MSFSYYLNFILFLSLFKIFYPRVDSKRVKPVIGIYGNSYPENDDEQFINGTYYPLSYVYWLESVGVEVMAIHYWYSFDIIDEILNKVNGILFLGGGRKMHKNGTWEIKAKYIMDFSLENQLPIWGTCQGFQLLAILLSDNYTFLRNVFDDNNILHGQEITNYTKSSKMYHLFTEKDFNILQYGNSTIYNHREGFFLEDFYREKRLNELFIVTGISEDKNGLKFINSFEGKNDSIKIFATQFHPEKNPYKRNNYILEQNIDSLKVSQLLVMSFYEEVKKNKNKFDSSSNKEGDRAQFDFFDTKIGMPNCNFDRNSETCYYYKRKEYSIE